MPESFHNDIKALGIQSLLDRDNQLGQDWQNLIFALADQRAKAFICKEFVGVIYFSKAVEENRQVVMVV